MFHQIPVRMRQETQSARHQCRDEREMLSLRPPRSTAKPRSSRTNCKSGAHRLSGSSLAPIVEVQRRAPARPEVGEGRCNECRHRLPRKPADSLSPLPLAER